MGLITITTNGSAERLIGRIELGIAATPTGVMAALSKSGTEIKTRLIDATPVGHETVETEAQPLRDSYVLTEGDMSVEISTTEPDKLRYVTQGTPTPILPVTKKALWWAEATHPMWSVRGQAANDFVTPVLDEAINIVVEQVQLAGQEIVAVIE